MSTRISSPSSLYSVVPLIITSTLHVNAHRAYALLLLFVLVISSAPCDASAQSARWDEAFLGYGVDGTVYDALVDTNGDLYIAGDFRRVGGLTVNGIARWDGIRWHALGNGISGGVKAAIHTMVFDDRGDLLVGGAFTEVRQSNDNIVEVSNLALWDGSKWEEVASGVNDIVYDLLADDREGIYVAGAFNQDGAEEFELNRIAVWDGSSLSPVGDGLGTFSGVVARTLAQDNDGGLYAGGTQLTGGILRWNGDTWNPIGAKHDGSVHDMVFGSDGRIYVGGDFRSVTQPDTTQLEALRIAAWNGSTWEALGMGFNTAVNTLHLGAGNVLFAGGAFTTSGDNAIDFQYAARWDGVWTSMGSTDTTVPSEGIHSLIEDRAGSLIAVGVMERLGSSLVNGVGFWDGAAWQGIGGSGLSDEVKTIHPYTDTDGQEVLYVGGEFTFAGSEVVNNIGRLENGQWTAIGQGTDGTVHAVEMDSQGTVYVGGSFTQVFQTDGTALLVNNMARWDGSAWTSLDTGVDGDVYTLAIDDSDVLYIGGAFTQDGAQQQTMNRMAMWDGTAWSPLGSGMDDVVHAVVVDGVGNVIAGGTYSAAGGVENTAFLSMWNGSVWSPLSPDTVFDGDVFALEMGANGVLSVGGAFTQVSASIAASYVAQWNGTAWSLLGTEMGNGVSECCVQALASTPDSTLFVGGNFQGVNQPAGPDLGANNVAMWSLAMGWEALDAGTDDEVLTVAVSANDVFFGGEFNMAGSLPSGYLGRWSPDVTYVSVDEEEIPLQTTLMDIYPNPVVQQATLRFSVDATQYVDVLLYDALGRRIDLLFEGVVPAAEDRWVSLNTSQLPAGMYYIRIIGETTTGHRPFIRLK